MTLLRIIQVSITTFLLKYTFFFIESEWPTHMTTLPINLKIGPLNLYFGGPRPIEKILPGHWICKKSEVNEIVCLTNYKLKSVYKTKTNLTTRGDTFFFIQKILFVPNSHRVIMIIDSFILNSCTFQLISNVAKHRSELLSVHKKHAANEAWKFASLMLSVWNVAALLCYYLVIRNYFFSMTMFMLMGRSSQPL